MWSPSSERTFPLHARVDESHLTGEADTVGKRPDSAPLMFSGSKVLEGGGRALVTAVGANSQQGIISGMVAGAQEQGDSLRWAAHHPAPDCNIIELEALSWLLNHCS